MLWPWQHGHCLSSCLELWSLLSSYTSDSVFQNSFLMFFKWPRAFVAAVISRKERAHHLNWHFAVLVSLGNGLSAYPIHAVRTKCWKAAVGIRDWFDFFEGWAVSVRWHQLLCFPLVNVVVFNFAGVSAGPNRSILLLGLLGTNSICWCNQRHGAGQVAVFLKARSPLAQENDTKLRTLLGEASTVPGCDSPGTC